MNMETTMSTHATVTHEPSYQFDCRTRYTHGDTNVGRCNGFTASSTCSMDVAARRASEKAWLAMWRTLGMPAPTDYEQTCKAMAGGVFVVTYIRRAS